MGVRGLGPTFLPQRATPLLRITIQCQFSLEGSGSISRNLAHHRGTQSSRHSVPHRLLGSVQASKSNPPLNKVSARVHPKIATQKSYHQCKCKCILGCEICPEVATTIGSCALPGQSKPNSLSTKFYPGTPTQACSTGRLVFENPPFFSRFSSSGPICF